ncbi:MAG: GNAT family N-acetyltransferase [Alphaproteobacteria bacterium]|nr:GNAT family N-acetyltransferase [Alphaproteobacteria bacterium]
MNVLETDRLILRRLGVEDAAFILELVNEPAWLRFIGDKGVKTLEDARAYIANGPAAMYAQYGFGLYLTALKASSTPIGICGLLKRDVLPDVDLGFAFLCRFWGNGYAFEAATGVLAHAKKELGLDRIVAVASPANCSSIKLLERLGLAFERRVRLAPDKPEAQLFARRD